MSNDAFDRTILAYLLIRLDWMSKGGEITRLLVTDGDVRSLVFCYLAPQSEFKGRRIVCAPWRDGKH
jgi:hypothetical protein